MAAIPAESDVIAAAVRQQRLDSPAPEEYGSFGDAVAVDGDTVVIGEPRGVFTTGEAWVYMRSGSTWVLQANLSVPGLEPPSGFGTSVDIDGDTVVVGAPGAHPSSAPSQTGVVYVFVRAGTTWSLQAELYTNESKGGIGFGEDVSLDVDTVVTGAISKSAPGKPLKPSGAAYVYVRTGASWSLQRTFRSDGGAYDDFGWSVDVHGNTIAISALKDSSPSTSKAGAVYIYVRTGSTWSQQARRFASDQRERGDFGYDLDLDGNTLVAGRQSGQAYVLVRSGSTWAEQAILNGPANEFFGLAVAVRGNTALVGASGAGGDGGTYVFVRTGSAWAQRTLLVPPDGTGQDIWYGSEVAYDGTTAVIGALQTAAAGLLTGSAYVVERT